MGDFATSLDLTASAMRAQAQRLRHLSENIANADTPGYRRKTVPFRLDDGRVSTGPVQLDPTEGEKIYDPSHPMADQSGHYSGSNVDLMIEVADAREAQRSYDANLRIFDQTRKMRSDLLSLLKR